MHSSEAMVLNSDGRRLQLAVSHVHCDCRLEGQTITVVNLKDFAAKQVTPPRARGALTLSSKQRGSTSVIDNLRQSGAMRMLFPTGADLTAIMINTSGGITGGDRLDVKATAGADSLLTLTTQAAERAYRASGEGPGRISTVLTVEDNATLHWLPQELILFEGARLDRRLQVNLAETASLLMVEPIVFGRMAMNETLSDVSFTDRIEVHRSGKPIYIDGLRFDGDVTAQLKSPAIANGAGAVASVVFVNTNARFLLETVRGCLPETAAASLLTDDILSLRFLTPDSFLLRRDLVPILELLRDAPLPTSWRL